MSTRGKKSKLPCPSYIHGLFLLTFVLFLIIGITFTCIGFLDDVLVEEIENQFINNTPESVEKYEELNQIDAKVKTYKILGIVSLMLCFGSLVAACVSASECCEYAEYGESAQPFSAYQYEMLFPINDIISPFESEVFTQQSSRNSIMLCEQKHTAAEERIRVCSPEMEICNDQQQITRNGFEFSNFIDDDYLEESRQKKFTAEHSQNIEMLKLTEFDMEQDKHWV